ncbi:MAG TPA: hypothetical protein VJA19_01080 [Pseudomonas sp.]|nr:hypothetical protein [Pseudomonas sp.]
MPTEAKTEQIPGEMLQQQSIATAPTTAMDALGTERVVFRADSLTGTAQGPPNLLPAEPIWLLLNGITSLFKRSLEAT